MVPCRKPFDKTSIGIACPAAQSVIEVANDELFVVEFDQLVKENSRIASAGNSHQISRRHRKFSESLILNPNHCGAHPIFDANDELENEATKQKRD